MASLTTKQKTNYAGFPKPAELIEITGGATLEASDRALHNMLLQIAHDSGRMTGLGEGWEVPFVTLRQALSTHNSNERVRQSLRRLMKVDVTVHYKSLKTGKPRTLETHLLDSIDTSDGEGEDATVQFSIPQNLRLLLARSNRWGRVKSEVTFAMTSKYAIALYELLCLRINMQNCVEVFTVKHFRDLLGVPPKAYERGDDFKKKVVELAVLEVNGLSDIGVQIDLRRRHPRAPVHEIAVAWWKKEGDEFRAAMEERNRHKAGRTARLRGAIDKITDEVAPQIALPQGGFAPSR